MEKGILSKRLYIILSAIVVIGGLYVTDQILHFPYVLKVASKLVLFFSFPIFYMFWSKYNIFVESYRNRTKPLRFKISHLLGLVIILTIGIAYLLIKPTINIETFQYELVHKYRINRNNMVLYGSYLVLVNSLMEEFFFRGFMFLGLKRLNMKKSAHIISALAFAIYHIGNIQNWFNLGIFLLATFGLFVGGLIFNALDDRQNTFFNSWFVHICADLIIVLIGYDLLI